MRGSERREEVEHRSKQFYDDGMTVQIEIAELGPKFEELVEKLAHNGGEACLTRDGKAVAKLSVEAAPEPTDASRKDLVLYNGRWMIPAAAERERSLERLRGTIKILGDIESPIDDVEWDALK
jgi:antitoxin (DNA-binding transcriptional repressor) of toxin-antitoxin stability system